MIERYSEKSIKVMMKYPTIVFYLLLALLSFPSRNADAETHPDSKNVIREIPLQCPWTVEVSSNEVELEAKILARGSIDHRVLKIFRENRLLFIYDPGFGLYPRNLFVLNDGNLATIWISGIFSYVHLFVYTYSNGKVHLALHTVSNSMDPEFAYQSKGHIMGEFENGQLRGGPFFQQRIIVPNTERTALKTPYLKENVDKQPISADIYSWERKTGKYKVLSKVPWRKRFQML
jgi:hypothetical protein